MGGRRFPAVEFGEGTQTWWGAAWLPDENSVSGATIDAPALYGLPWT